MASQVTGGKKIEQKKKLIDCKIDSIVTGIFCRVIFLFFIFSFLSPFPVFANSGKIVFSSLSIKDGLLSPNIWDIIQDKNGIIWIGTEMGLYWYDGNRFTQFSLGKESKTDPTTVWSLFLDSSGTLWAGSYYRGLYKIDWKSQTFKNYTFHDPKHPDTNMQNWVRTIHESPDHPGIFLLGTYEGLIRFNTKDGSFKIFRIDQDRDTSLTGNRVYCIYEEMGGVFWIGTGQGLCKIKKMDIFSDDPDLKMTIFRHDPINKESISNDIIRAIFKDRLNRLWLGTDDGLNMMEDKTGRFIRHKYNGNDPESISNNSISAIKEDWDGNIWVGTWGGGVNLLDRNNLNSPSFTRYRSDSENEKSINNNFIRTIYQDKNGLIWVGTDGGGLNMNHKYQFNSAKKNSLFPVDIAGQGVWPVFVEKNRDRKSLWTGLTNMGLYEVTYFKNRITGYNHYQFQPGNVNSLSGNMVRALQNDNINMDILWIGLYSEGLNCLNTKTGKIKQYKKYTDDSRTLQFGSVFSLHISPIEQKILWIGTDKGIYQIIREEGKDPEFFKINYNHTFKQKLKHNDILVFHESKGPQKILWIGNSEQGLTGLFLPGKNREADKLVHKDQRGRSYKAIHFFHDPDNSNSLSSDRVSSICETENGVLYVGTGNGFNRIIFDDQHIADMDKVRIKNFTKTEGLPDNRIQAILEDGKGNLWISTMLGISKFDPETEKFLNYGRSDGLPSDKFNESSCFKGPDNQIYFGHSLGLTNFNPLDIEDDKKIPSILLTDFRLFNRSVPISESSRDDGFYLDAHISELQSLVLPYDQNIFSFHFAVADYKRPEDNKYAYKMEGINRDWIYSGMNSAGYTHLPHGDYVFRVKGAKSNGIWNEEGISIKVRILPPWYQTWWAYVLYFLTFFSILLGVRQYEKNRQSHKYLAELKNVEAEKLNDINKSKSLFFANISHEFRTPLTLILGRLEDELSFKDQKRETKNIKIVRRNAKQLQGMIDQLLDLSKLEAGEMKLSMTEEDIVLFLNRLSGGFESLASSKKIKLLFESSAENIPLFFDREKMERIIYNLLSNAMKFTPPGGTVELKVEREMEKDIAGNVKIIVTDTGIGIPEDKLPHIFDRFYQVDNKVSRKYEGTGIGLALVMELVQTHSGSISVKSKIDSGTTFIITLPSGSAHLSPEQIRAEKPLYDPDLSEYLPDLTEPEPPVAKNNTAGKTLPVKTGKKLSSNTILIVEDNREMRSYIADSLGTSYKIIEAEDGKKGFEKAKDQVPDLIVTDVMMPGTDGYELTRLLRDERLTCHIPVIMLTAKAAEEDKYTGLESGVDAYLTKPFSSRELQIRVRKLIELRNLQQEQSGGKAILDPEDVEISSMDEEFLRSVNEYINKNIDNGDLSVEDLASHTYIGSRQLQRKLKALTGMSPKQCIWKLRLHRAKQLIEQDADTVSRITFMVGYSDFSSFSRAFKEEFGKSPSAFKSDK